MWDSGCGQQCWAGCIHKQPPGLNFCVLKQQMNLPFLAECLDPVEFQSLVKCGGRWLSYGTGDVLCIFFLGNRLWNICIHTQKLHFALEMWIFLSAYCNNSATPHLEGGILKPKQQWDPGLSCQRDLPGRSNTSENGCSSGIWVVLLWVVAEVYLWDLK